MPEDRTQRWQRVARADTSLDPLHALRMVIVEVRGAPRDPELRRRLRAIAAEQGLWDELALLLADEARATDDRPEVAAAFHEELADVHENLDRLIDAVAAMEQVVARIDEPAQHERLAGLYLRAGANVKAAASFAQVGSRSALRTAARMYRTHGKREDAAATYRAIATRWPGDAEATAALDELLAELGRWREVAEVRAERASRASAGVDKAALLRAQARALEQVGEHALAAEVVARASKHAPDQLSGIVDYADVLARGGQGGEAAALLASRIVAAQEDGAPADDVAALQLRHAVILDDTCGDAAAATRVLDELLAVSPRYVPALEHRAARAARAGDAGAHAAALRAYAAALVDPGERAAALAEAARRSRDAGDHVAAARAYQEASELSPDDDALREELDDARATLVVARAAGDGDAAGAERRLRGVLAARADHVPAALALADLLERAGRLDDASDHLRATLAALPDSAPGPRVASIVARTAQVAAARGESDDAHQLLHEAHRLDRRALPIALALGESCFARRVWRQAALHLGALADHPDAPAHAAEVARGLVHAAQAEIRGLRPANAARHYEAAVGLDPACGPALHALAEAAIERGDVAAGADLLEREAAATPDARDRLRLYDALGDMAQEVLGDPARAERCWASLGDAASADVLGKLVAVQRARGATRELGETCVRLAAQQAEPRARKPLLEEAASAFLAAGDVARADELAPLLVALYPRDEATLACASAVAAAAGDAARVARWLRAPLAAWPAGSGPDARRAQLWRRLGDADRDLGDELAATRAYKRAVELAPDDAIGTASRRALVELAATTGRAAMSSLIALVEGEQDPFDVLAWARGLARDGEIEDARAAFELARAVGARLVATDDRFLASHPAPVMASDQAYGAVLDDAERRALVDDPADGALAEIVELLAEAAPLIAPDARAALAAAGLASAPRLAASSHSAVVALYPPLARAFGGPATLLHEGADAELRLLYAAPPVLVVGRRLAAQRPASRAEIPLAAARDGDAALRFQLGRIVELARPRRLLAADPAFTRTIAAVRVAFAGASADVALAAEAERLRTRIPVALRARLVDRLATAGELDPAAYVAACSRAADRVGLLACGDVAVAVACAGGREAATHLVRLASTPRYLAARRKLRPRAT